VFHEALYLGDKQYTSLLNLNQVRYAGHKADDIPLFLSQGRSLHGIEMIDSDYIPFQPKGKSSLLYTCMPTEREMDTATLIELTSDAPWDPSETDWEGEEEKYTRKHRKTRIVHSKPDQLADTSEEDSSCGVLGFNTGEQQIFDDILRDMPQVRTARYSNCAAPVKSSK
jgi:hypothetical protein